MFMRNLLLTVFGGACLAIGFAFAQQQIPTAGYVGHYTTVAALTTAMPAVTGNTNSWAITDDAGLVYNVGTVWTAATGYLPSTTLTMPTTAVLLGCGTATTVAIPNATNFNATPSANPGNVNVQAWITGSGTSGATANVAYCTALISVTPSAVSFLIKPFSR